MAMLDVTVVRCRSVKGHDWFSETDPYVTLKYGKQRRKTGVQYDAGANANFLETLHFPTQPLPDDLGDLQVTVMDKDLLIDEIMGEHNVHLATLLEKGHWCGEVPLQDKKGKKNGTVTLCIKMKKHVSF